MQFNRIYGTLGTLNSGARFRNELPRDTNFQSCSSGLFLTLKSELSYISLVILSSISLSLYFPPSSFNLLRPIASLHFAEQGTSTTWRGKNRKRDDEIGQENMRQGGILGYFVGDESKNYMRFKKSGRFQIQNSFYIPNRDIESTG